jgi:hypothetical protein
MCGDGKGDGSRSPSDRHRLRPRTSQPLAASSTQPRLGQGCPTYASPVVKLADPFA